MPDRLRTLMTAAVMAATCLTGAAGRAQDPLDPFQKKVRPALERKCFSCHSGDDAEAGLDLAKFKSEADAIEAQEVFQNVFERINRAEMPPDGSPGLEDGERHPILAWIEEHRKADGHCDELATDGTQSYYQGHVMSRRLNREEYNNSIRDLIGLDLRPADSFPSDGSGGEGFDNVGDTLFLSSVLLERYLAAATEVLDIVCATGHASGTHRLSEQEIAAAKERIFIAKPSDYLSPREAAAEIIRAFAARAFRRPVADEEVERLLTMFDRGFQRGDGFERSVKLSLTAVLISPHFLFMVESPPESEGVYQLGPYELATKLSYFLWNSMPDEELLSLAGESKLLEPEILRGQVRRMLADPKVRGLSESFATQWLGIGSLGVTARPDPERFPHFDDQLAAAMRQEAVLLVEHLLRENRSVLELVDCNYAFVNDRLAAHYGLPPVEGDEFRRVHLDDRRRGGVTGLGAVLTTTSLPLRTSPVLRGRWVLEQVLGGHVPPPPPNAGVLPEDDQSHADLTLREQLEQHRTKPECAACHQTMDPLGFGLEAFDATGRWRHHAQGKRIDASGTLPSGESFTGPAELKQVVLQRKGEFLNNLSRKLLGYGLGRGLGKFDDCVVKTCLEALEANEYRSGALIEQIVLSYPFQHRYGKK